MKYHGGKSRLGKHIATVLQQYGKPNLVRGYIEPFCGSLGVMVHMANSGYHTLKAYDICPDLIMLWNALKNDEFKFPTIVTEKLWLKYKNTKEPSALRAFLGFGCSYQGKWFETYAQKYYEDNVTPAHIQAKNSILKKIDAIKKVEFKCIDYKKLVNRGWKNYLIYCDPPYKNTRGFRGAKGAGGTYTMFDHETFWNTVRKWSQDNIVIVSEYEAPDDFECIWSKPKQYKKSDQTISKSIEKLFILRSRSS